MRPPFAAGLLAVVAGCTASPPAAPPFRIALDASTGQGIAPRRVVSVGAREAIVEGAIGAVVLTPTGAELPPSYAVVLVVGGATASLEGLRLEADTWRVETALGLSETITDGAWGRAAPAGTSVRIEALGPGRLRLTLPRGTLERFAASRTARIAWVDAYRR